MSTCNDYLCRIFAKSFSNFNRKFELQNAAQGLKPAPVCFAEVKRLNLQEERRGSG